MNYANIKNFDIANGEGVRVSLFVSGCRHHCKGCFNSVAWDFNYGSSFDDSVIENLINLSSNENIVGLTLLGGEPFEPENQEGLIKFLRIYKDKFPSKNIWCYTGYSLDKDLISGGNVYTKYTSEMLSYIDILVDGKFIIDLKDITLKFRGSSNQRIIDLKKSKALNQIVLRDDLMKK